LAILRGSDYNTSCELGYIVTTQQRLTEDMKISMKAGEAERTGVLRLLRGAIKNEEIKIGHPLDESEALKVLQKEAKQRRDSIAAYESAGRADLKLVEQAELGIIEGYLPDAMSEAELKTIIEAVISELGSVDAQQMGQVIGAVMKRAGARADGALVSRLVRERLGE
jgi:uncharacterized protein YqeY